ncbi:MAG: hypothetical protein HY043_13050 [Verrucomicrobia bacterium]|nr:hypothetical protein [Verrucomicrobiota bacterium]
MTREISLFLQLLFLVAFAIPATTSLANALDLKINLVASTTFPNAKGAAKFRDRSNQQEFQVEAEVSRRFAGSVFTVCVNGQPVGGMVVDAFGKARLSFDSKLGQTVPAIQAGSLVEVKTATGVLVLSGRF